MMTRALLALTLAFGMAACGESDTKTSENDDHVKREVRQVAEAPAASSDLAAAVEVAEKAEAEPKGPAALAFRSDAGELRLDETRIVDAIVSTDDTNEGWFVFVQMDQRAGEDLFDLSNKSVGKKLAVMVNGEVVSEPVVQTAIGGGGFLITVEDADKAQEIVSAIRKDDAG